MKKNSDIFQKSAREPLCLSWRVVHRIRSLISQFPSPATDNAPTHAGYGGQTESGNRFVLFGARWYDSAFGRWVTRDPIGYAGGANLYAFANDDPVNNIDPSGLDPEDDDLQIMRNGKQIWVQARNNEINNAGIDLPGSHR